jgi:hypothetical protein
VNINLSSPLCPALTVFKGCRRQGPLEQVALFLIKSADQDLKNTGIGSLLLKDNPYINIPVEHTGF